MYVCVFVTFFPLLHESGQQQEKEGGHVLLSTPSCVVFLSPVGIVHTFMMMCCELFLRMLPASKSPYPAMTRNMMAVANSSHRVSTALSSSSNRDTKDGSSWTHTHTHTNSHQLTPTHCAPKMTFQCHSQHKYMCVRFRGTTESLPRTGGACVCVFLDALLGAKPLPQPGNTQHTHTHTNL